MKGERKIALKFAEFSLEQRRADGQNGGEADGMSPSSKMRDNSRI